ncbi:MAG: TIGR01777 family protein [Nitrospinae bacterium]|nr:TIGR01777 family protein [Nitrospinota bacterium]
MKIAITGSTGFVGKNLHAALVTEGHEVAPIGRQDLAAGADRLAEKMSGVDVVINLAGSPVIARWTDGYKKELYESRVGVTARLVCAFEKMGRKPVLFISASAVGYYSDAGKQTEESCTRSDGLLGDLCQKWEDAARLAEKLGVRTVVFRFGIVLGKGGGAIAKMLLPFKLGLGGIIGDGKQAVSWVHIKDLERAFSAAIAQKTYAGVYNLVAPNPTTNKGLTKALGAALGRPTVLPVPAFALRLIFGDGADVLIKGQEVHPKRLTEAGFKFLYPDVESAVRASI